jgi:hypothetical protein
MSRLAQPWLAATEMAGMMQVECNGYTCRAWMINLINRASEI